MKGKFKKGESGNPSGKRKLERLEISGEICSEALAILWGKVKRGEGWAIKIFFDVAKATGAFDRKIKTIIKEGDPKTLIESLGYVEEMTLDELLKTVKTVGDLELAKETGQTIGKFLTDDKMKELAKWIKDSKESKN